MRNLIRCFIFNKFFFLLLSFGYSLFIDINTEVINDHFVRKCRKSWLAQGKTNFKQGAHTHQPTVWPVPHAYAQPYHPDSGSHGQLFRPYWVLSEHGQRNGSFTIDKFIMCI